MIKSYIFRKGLWAFISLSFMLLVAAVFFYIYAQSQLPSVDSLKTVQLQVPLRIYSEEGLLIQEYGEKRRIPLTYDQIPKMLVYALLATEDQRFFDHGGVDILGLGRATLRMIKTGTKSQGASTITMQVARNFFLNRKKTFLRKFNEIMLAIKIDRELSKEKILELYLNKIFLGNRAYGVGAAAIIYYGKPLQELSLAQLAMIAGLPQAPSTQNPITNPKAAKKRRDHVLQRLLEEKYISQSQYEAAVAEPVIAEYHSARIEVSAPYVAEMIRQSLYDSFGEEAYTKGYKVYTTVKANLQNTADQVIEKHLLSYDRRHGYRGPVAHLDHATKELEINISKVLAPYPEINDLSAAIVTGVAEQSVQAMKRDGQMISIPWKGLAWARPAMRKGYMGAAPKKASQIVKTGDVIYVHHQNDIWELTQIPEIEAAIVAINPNNGAIEALVGGLNFQKSKFNRATQSSRQPGSSFKPFVYAAALDKGYTLSTLVNDAPIAIYDPSLPDLWRPQNDTMTFNGPTRLREALVRSRNLVSIRVLDDIGIGYAIDYLARFGFDKKRMPHGLSLALGSLTVSPLQLATAYAVFANGGYRIEPYLIERITDNEGKVLLQAKPVVVCRENCINLNKQRHATRVIPEDVAFLMHTAMLDVVRFGTAHAATVLNRPDIAGKTGTTNEQVDTWFAGYHPDLVVTTWVGYDTPAPLHEYAAQLSLPLWIDFMRVALKSLPEHIVEPPKNIISMKINPATGLIANERLAGSINEYFKKDELPGEDNASLFSDTDNASSSTQNEEDLF